MVKILTNYRSGTWYGGGSTQALAKGLQESGSHKVLITIEMYEPAWQYARKRLIGYPVICLLAGTVPKEQYLTPDEIPDEEKTEHYKLYYERDIKLAEQHEPILEPLCKSFRFDAVLIDGNEYTGYAEFKIIDSICKPKYLMLHDVGTLKTKKISVELNKNPQKYQLVSKGSDKDSIWEIYKINY